METAQFCLSLISSNDRLRGGEGNDLLDGGTGNDELVDFGGDETYVLATAVAMIVFSWA